MNRYNIPPNMQWRNGTAETQQKTIQVTGEGIVSSVPNKADIVLGVVTENTNVENAQNQNSNLTNSVVNVLLREGIEKEKLQTISYNVAPEYDYKDGQSVFRGYKVTHLFKITTTDVANIGRLIDVTTSAGANRVDSVTFGLINRDELYNISLRNAIQNSNEKAATIATAFGVRISNVPLSVREISSPPFQPVMYSAEAFSVKSDAATPIQGGSLQVKAEVVTEYSIV